MRDALVDRRRLLLGGAALGFTLVADPFAVVRAAAGPGGPDPVTTLLRAYVSTLVPDGDDDPDGRPGGVAAMGVEQIQEHVPYVIPPIVTDLTAAALAAHNQAFADLGYAEREALLVAAFADDSRSPYHLIAMAIGAGAFYGSFANRVGGEHLGFPGPSDGHLGTYTDRTGHGQPQRDAVPT